jgi:hypothetical protein
MWVLRTPPSVPVPVHARSRLYSPASRTTQMPSRAALQEAGSIEKFEIPGTFY